MAGRDASSVGQPLPQAGRCVVPREKVLDYLLNLNNVQGRSKAKFFLGCGFTRDGWQDLASELVHHGQSNAVTSTLPDKWGIRYVIDAPLACPDGHVRLVRSVWMLDEGTGGPRLISAYPA